MKFPAIGRRATQTIVIEHWNSKLETKFFLKLSPWKGVIRFRRKGKLSPRYIELYEILTRVGPVAYKLKLPAELSRIHNVFHVSMLRKYVSDSSHIL